MKAKFPLHLRAQEPLPSGIRRIARGQIDAACHVLKGGLDPHTAVHEARKSLKKVRAILQLIAPKLGRRQFRVEKLPFQNAARLLAPLRDADAQLKSLDAFIQEAGFAPKDFARVRRALAADAGRLAREAEQPKRQAVAILERARKRVQRWPLGEMEWKHLVEEIRRAYRKGRNALELSRKEQTDVAFHAWRKHVKELWYHLRIVRALFPGAVEQEIALSGEIGEIAGNARDLALLRKTLATHKTGSGAALLIDEIGKRLPELHQAAAERGIRLYAEKPGAFAKRLL